MSERAIGRLRQAMGGLPRKVDVRRGGLTIAGILAATGLLFAGLSLRLDLGSIGLPGPGFFPLVLGLLIVAFSIVIGIERWRTPSNGETVELGHRDVLIVLAAALMVPPLFDPLGAYLTLGLFGVVLLVLVARVSPLLAIASAVVGMAACWYFFQVLLGLQIPMGPF
jgi:putative tricarboxylic transport membrane protein